MTTELITLSNGFEVIFLENKNADIVSLSLVGRAGNSFEDIPGTAHFLEHVVLDGSDKFPNKDTLTSLVTSSGGVYNARTGKEFVEFVTKTISQDSENAFEFISQVVFHPSIRKSDVEKERKIILQEIARAKSDNKRQLFEKAMKLTYKSKSLSRMILGNSSSVKKIKKEDLKNFWLKHYTPNNFVLCVTGNSNLKYIRQLSEKYFGKLKGGRSATKFKNHKVRNTLNVDVLKRESVYQSRMIISYPAPLPSDLTNHFTTILISYILGRGQTSRLFIKIREELNLAYDISSWVTRGVGFCMFYIEAGVNPAELNKTISEIADELRKLMDSPLTNYELDRAKKQLRSYMLFNFENSLNYASFHAILRHSYPGLNSYKDELIEFNKISAKDIRTVATKLFTQKPNIAVLTEKLDRTKVNVHSLLNLIST